MGNVPCFHSIDGCLGGERSTEDARPAARPSNKVSARKLWAGADELEVKLNAADPTRSSL